MTNSLKKPINTTAAHERNPGGTLSDAVLMGAPTMIKRQEANGQASFVTSDTLPTELGGEAARCILEGYGIKFLGPVEDDELFQYVELPAGWSKQPSSHAMWSKLVDEKGRKRASVFYKASFYDRGAHLHLTRRFSVAVDYERRDREGVGAASILDCERVVHTVTVSPNARESAYDLGWRVQRASELWLDERWPDWRNPGAYWDVEGEHAPGVVLP